MGRLFWKLFLFIWLGQVAAVVGTGVIFSLEREHARPPRATGAFPPPDFQEHHPPMPPDGESRPHSHRPPPNHGKPPPGPVPLFPLIAALIASVLCAAGIAWYFAKPIRHLRHAFTSVAEGKLDTRVGNAMGGRRDELANLGQDFDRMAVRLQTLIAGQKRLLHDVSHEMRSPLARLQAAIGLVRQQPSRLDDTLPRIEREGERINGLIGELLTLSRLEAGVEMPREKVELGELLAGITDDASFEGASRQVGIDFSAEPNLFVEANPELLHRAIENVVRNGLRFSPSGGQLRIDARRENGTLIRLSIADQGEGVPATELDAIFTPFHRGQNVPTGDGYGLGLAIARQVVSSVNGKIIARSKPDGSSGLLIDIELPAAD